MNDLLESEKRKVRYEFLTLRNRLDALNISSYSGMIFAKICELPVYQKAKTVMFYLSYGSEVLTDPMITSSIGSGKSVVVPAIASPGDAQMTAVKLSNIEAANQFVYGVRQPEIDEENVVAKEDIDVVFVPAIVFDVNGYRTGYGKGYYDRWLKGVPVEKTVGIAFDFQVADKVPFGEFDLPVGTIVTEKRIIYANKIKKN
ncbi:5-formyltetrahydrofolate cyclo-ligase [Endomicrobium proavitum]|uniref:5-formyltetrahydrofolate cyclo-ligase n=1 Tax=Endomicrobium proavitum TaxID=1408281 RepID=UPI0006988A53|nr:5-formyltetrahydrofolate cyclo-ligase [Endomicrobium proavitum]